MKIVAVFHSSDVIPFGIFYCESVEEFPGGRLKIETDQTIIEICDSDYYHVFDAVDVTDENWMVEKIKDFMTGLNKG